MGVPGTAARLFSALEKLDINVILIAQASSEQSLCFAVPQSQGLIAQVAVKKAFHYDLQQNLINSVDMVTPCTIMAVRKLGKPCL